MKRLMLSSAIACASLLGSLSAQAAIGLPDSESCNNSFSNCLAITNTSTINGAIAIYGQGTPGIYGVSNVQYGVEGITATGAGVYGNSSSTGYGIYGSSTSGDGVFGTSTNGNGIYVTSTNSDAAVADAGNCSGCAGFYGRANAGNSGSFAFYGKGNLKLVAGNGESGDAYKPTGTAWINTSDARLKKDIKDFTTGLSQLTKVHTVKFKFNGLADTQDDGREHVGVLAQELEKVFPSMVSTRRGKLHPTDTNEIDIKQVDANDFTFMLINSVKELSAQNEALQKRVKVLEDTHPRFAAGLGGNGLLGLGLGILGCALVTLRRRVTKA